MKINLNIKGLKELERKLGEQGKKKVLKQVSDEMQIAANNVRNKAINRVPVDQGYLRNSINVEGNELLWIVYASAEYAGHQEFGTKTKVVIPPEMQAEAAKFRNGKSTKGQFKEAIADWMRRKGIPEKALWPIMAKIMKVGLKPQPFMYPSLLEGTAQLEKELNTIIQRELDR